MLENISPPHPLLLPNGEKEGSAQTPKSAIPSPLGEKDRMRGKTFETRHDLRAGDVEAIEALVAATGFFTEEEVGVAGLLAADRLEKGTSSEYEFLIVEANGALAGYACYGRTPCTGANYDLYWIAVAPAHQGLGLGRALFAEVEAIVARAGGRRIYAETSGTDTYAPTRKFYLGAGFQCEAVLKDFYRDGDDKVIYMKVPQP